MAYRDPNLKNNKATKVRLNSYVYRQIEFLCDFTGAEKAVVMRELVELGLRELNNADSALVIDFKKGSKGVLKRAS